ncbi:MAG TPA: hypothetical protein VI522_03855, partial [Gammaproteobacteria bacterium]|nr:hypothetical protein [Gammaproteobacteria bacterium]
MLNFLKRFLLCAILLGMSLSSFADETIVDAPGEAPVNGSSERYYSDRFIVEDIRVEGLQRIDVGTVYNDLPINVGDTFENSETIEVIRTLYATGNYSDIELAREGNTLIVMVEERPTIGSIDIRGNEDIDEEDLEEGLTFAGISEGNPYDPS